MKRGKQIAITAIIFFALLTIPVILQVIEKTSSTLSFIANDETLEFESTTKYALTPTVKGEIKSIKITGKVLGEGQAKVLLGDKVIFDSYLQDQETITITGDAITGFVVNETNSTNTTETNSTNTTETNSTNTTETNSTNTTETNVTETNSTNTTETNSTNTTETNSTNTTETNSTNTTTNETTTDTDTTADTDDDDATTETTTEETTNSTETNSTNTTTNETTEILEQVKEVQIIETPTPEILDNSGGSSTPTFDESIQKEFEKECKDTCKLKDILFSEEYVLEIIVENSKLIIYEIEYEIVPIK